MPAVIVIKAEQLANVVRRLRQMRVQPDDAQLQDKIEGAFRRILGGDIDENAALTDIDLPDLEEGAQADINANNLVALSAIYFAAQLEDMKFFVVADKIAEHFQTGMVPISRGAAAGEVWEYIKKARDRLNEVERRSLYARAFGIAQGQVDEPLPNREFADLWLRFLSSVSQYQREQGADVVKSITKQAAMKSARDLAVNLSMHGYGIAHFAAVELQDTIKKLLKVYTYPDMLLAYGATDRWQLVERVSALFLGGQVNSVRQRTLATCGKEIIQWLALNQPNLVDPAGDLDLTDSRLVPFVERWLAVTGTGKDSVEKFSAPISVNQQPTIPSFSLQTVPAGLPGDALRGAMDNVVALTPNVA